jgi:hypothetical protein
MISGHFICKFNCFEKTDVAVVDWSCISHLQGGYYHWGMNTEDDQPANWICPQDAPFVKEILHHLSHIISHKNKRAVLLSYKIQYVRLGARCW